MIPSRIVLGTAMAVGLAGGAAGCAPGPAGYAGWANYRQHQAEEHAYFSQRNAEAAQRQEARGDYAGAQQSQAAADAEAAQAEQAHQRAARDRWLSQF